MTKTLRQRLLTKGELNNILYRADLPDMSDTKLPLKTLETHMLEKITNDVRFDSLRNNFRTPTSTATERN